MHAPEILVRTLTRSVPMGPKRIEWQYHSRSDRHSKVAYWGVLFDLLLTSRLLREHVSAGHVVFGVNHPMHDFVNDQQKYLDLVIARPADRSLNRNPRTLSHLALRYGIDLTDEQQNLLARLPVAIEGAVGAVLVALEAKACMTEHGKARPRLYDELNSSHQIIHAATNQALAIGFVMVNAATEFVSPGRNSQMSAGVDPVRSMHRQPQAVEITIEKVKMLPRRSDTSSRGYDGLGIVVVDMRNDGSPVRLVTDPPAPQPGDIFHYEAMIRRMSSEYDSAFRRI